MGLEAASFIGDLNALNPDGTDQKSEGDNHLRMIKQVLKATFPNMAGAAWRTQTKGSTYTVVANDNMSVIECTATFTLNLTAAATLGNGHMFLAHVSGGDGATIDPAGAELINGLSSIIVPAGMVGLIFCTGTAFKCFTIPTVSSMTTGDVKASFKAVADPGWVIMNDGSIGSGASGATTRANADTFALYQVLWTNVSNTFAPVSGGRGASAVADFNANKTLGLPKALGRALAAAGSGAGLTARALGESLGSENAIVVTHDHNAVTGVTNDDHTHSISDPGHGHSASFVYTSAGSVPSNNDVTGTNDNTGGGLKSVSVGSSGTGISVLGASVPTHSHTIASSGSSGTGANMPPETFMNFFVKL